MTTEKGKSRILDDVHKTALGLHDAGLTSKRRTREFDALCNLEVQGMPPPRIKSLRKNARVSQAVFAASLNPRLSAVQKWEIGDKKPGGLSLKLLSLVERKGLQAVL